MDKVLSEADAMLSKFSQWKMKDMSYDPFMTARVTEGDLQALQRATTDVAVARDIGLNNSRVAYDHRESYTVSVRDAVEEYVNNSAEPSGLFMYPPNAFCGWHTNSNNVGERLYLSWCLEGGKSYFREVDPKTGKMHTRWEKQGWNVNRFSIDAQALRWHCVYSNTLRISMGFNIRTPTGFTFIHIGRCGGSSIEAQLRQDKVDFESVHMKEVQHRKGVKYVIVLRNPIERFVSAFNWVFYRLETEGYRPELRERYIANNPSIDEMRRFGTVNGLAEALYDASGTLNESVNHIIKRPGVYRSEPCQIGMGIAEYMKKFVQRVDAADIKGVICHQSLKEDYQRVIGMDLTTHEKRGGCYPTNLSDQARKNLHMYLKADFECIDMLYAIGVIESTSYRLLINHHPLS